MWAPRGQRPQLDLKSAHYFDLPTSVCRHIFRSPFFQGGFSHLLGGTGLPKFLPPFWQEFISRHFGLQHSLTKVARILAKNGQKAKQPCEYHPNMVHLSCD
jgi:hypothetical protein